MSTYHDSYQIHARKSPAQLRRTFRRWTRIGNTQEQWDALMVTMSHTLPAKRVEVARLIREDHQLHGPAIEEYRAAFEGGEEVRPVVLEGNHVADGNHRVTAALQAGVTHIEAVLATTERGAA